MPYYGDEPDGVLVIGESKKSVPFNIKRVYYINKLGKPKSIRGKHAHKKLSQIIFCINGSFNLHLDDGAVRQKIKMRDPYTGIKLGPMLWHEMTDFSDNCVILVLADNFYKESDYIRDYDMFKKYVSKKNR